MAEPTFFLSSVNEIYNATLNGAAGGGGSPTGLEVDNLKDDDLGIFWRNTGTPADNMILRASWPTSVTASVFALLSTNLVPGDVVTFRFSNDGGSTFFAEQDLQLHVDPALGYSADFKWAAPEELTFDFLELRFDVVDESPIRDRIDAGGLWVGKRFSPAHGINYQSQPSIADPSETSFTRGQQARVNEQRPYRMASCSFPALRESELVGRYGDEGTNLYDIYMRNGARRTVIAGLFGDDAACSLERNYLVNRFAIYGYMQTQLMPQPFNASSGERIYSLVLQVREILGMDYSQG